MNPGGRMAPKEALMRAILPHIAFDGWTRTAMARGAADAGMAVSEALRHFPAGPADVFRFFSAWADGQLAHSPPAGNRLHERIGAAVRTRIEIMSPWRESVRRGIAYAALPAQGALGLRCLYRTLDEIWYIAGDRSADFSFYTKRASLAAIYGATVLYWLDDRSEGYAETWSFLERRIADTGRIRDLKSRVTRLLAGLPDPRRVVRPDARGFTR